MQTALFWGTPTHFYSEDPILAGDSIEKTFEKMAMDLASSFQNQEQKHILGLPDPLIIIERESVSNLKLVDMYRDGIKKSVVSILPYFTEKYNVKKGSFTVDDLCVFAKIIRDCAGYPVSDEQVKIKARVGSGIATPLSSLSKADITRVVRCRLRCFVLNNHLGIGGLAPMVIDAAGPVIIDSGFDNILITKTEATVSSWDFMPNPNLTDEGPKKNMGYRIPAGLDLALKAIAEQRGTTFTDVFKEALLSDRFGKPQNS